MLSSFRACLRLSFIVMVYSRQNLASLFQMTGPMPYHVGASDCAEAVSQFKIEGKITDERTPHPCCRG